ncbi:Uncharacterised protein [Mycobacteroides abscessus subsp. abscessus]|nr:Uncharacterised protein [Mycobacteroides abscessus subsp. abscessus]
MVTTDRIAPNASLSAPSSSSCRVSMSPVRWVTTLPEVYFSWNPTSRRWVCASRTKQKVVIPPSRAAPAYPPTARLSGPQSPARPAPMPRSRA